MILLESSVFDFNVEDLGGEDFTEVVSGVSEIFKFSLVFSTLDNFLGANDGIH